MRPHAWQWHIGYVNDTCAPWGRGLDSYIGYMNGNEGYYAHGFGPYPDWHACGLPPTTHPPASLVEASHATAHNFSTCDACSHLYDGRYSTEVYAQRATDLICAWKPGDPPLFVYLAWQAVHEPIEAPARFVKRFGAIGDRSRRVYAAMLLALDEGIKYTLPLTFLPSLP